MLHIRIFRYLQPASVAVLPNAYTKYLTLILFPTVVGLPRLSDLMSSGNRDRMNGLEKADTGVRQLHTAGITWSWYSNVGATKL